MRNEGFGGGEFNPTEQIEAGKEDVDLTPVERKIKSFETAGLAAKIVKDKKLKLHSLGFIDEPNT